jgi:hypothetical protein
MLSIFWKDKKATIALLLFIAFSSWWGYIRLADVTSEDQLNFFAGTYGVLAVLGGISGIVISRKWGGFKSVIGRAILMFSLGLLAQEFGQLVYAYYVIVSKIEIPYPSIGDIGYFGSIPLYIYGAWLLAQASASKISLRSMVNKVQAVVIPVILLAVSYTLFLKGYDATEVGTLTKLLDFGYPLGQAIYISIAILAFLLSRKLLGGLMRNKILLILFALCAQYVADFNFLYQNSHETWVTGGYGDYLYIVAYFLMAVGLINLGQKLTAEVAEPVVLTETQNEEQQNG